MLRGFSWVLVGVLWGSQVLAGNLQGFLWDDHGAFKTPERPLQKAPLIHPMIYYIYIIYIHWDLMGYIYISKCNQKISVVKRWTIFSYGTMVMTQLRGNYNGQWNKLPIMVGWPASERFDHGWSWPTWVCRLLYTITNPYHYRTIVFGGLFPAPSGDKTFYPPHSVVW